MLSRIGEPISLLGLIGRVTTCSPNAAYAEFGNDGFLAVLADCNGPHDCLILLVLPDWVVANEAQRESTQQEILDFFQLMPQNCRLRLASVDSFANHDDFGQHAKRFREPLVGTNRDAENPLGRENNVWVAAAVGSSVGSADSPPSPFVAELNSRYASPTPHAPLSLESVVGSFIPSYRWHRERSEDIYSVPKRFDLASMFSISVAFAMLFSIMRALDSSPLLIAIFGIYFAAVGIAQAVLFNGDKPREASVIAGGILGCLSVIVIAMSEGAPLGAAISMTICSAVWAPVAGYLAGTINGGIWLITDYLRQWLERRSPTSDPAEPTPGPFDDLRSKHEEAPNHDGREDRFI